MIWTALQEWWCVLPHWLCNETKSLPTSPPFPSLISCLLPSIRPPLSPHLLFATCTGTESPVSLRDTSICSTVDIYGQARSLSFIWFFFSRSCFRPSPSSARVSQWLMTPQVRLKRLKVWHLSTGPAAWMLTSMWCDTHRHMCVHLWAVMQFLEKEEKNPQKDKTYCQMYDQSISPCWFYYQVHTFTVIGSPFRCPALFFGPDWLTHWCVSSVHVT